MFAILPKMSQTEDSCYGGRDFGYECAYYFWPGLFWALLLNTTLMSQIRHHRHFEHGSNNLNFEWYRRSLYL